MATSDLIGEAMQLGGVVHPFIGSLFFRRWLDKDKTSYCIVAVHFQDFQQAREATEQADKWGWEGFTDIINLKVNGATLPDDDKDDAPVCPIHGSRFVASSKKRPGSFFCKARVGEKYCNWTSD